MWQRYHWYQQEALEAPWGVEERYPSWMLLSLHRYPIDTFEVAKPSKMLVYRHFKILERTRLPHQHKLMDDTEVS